MYGESDSPALRAIVYIEGECCPPFPSVKKTALCAVSGPDALGRTLGERGLSAGECLLIAATDAAVRAARQLDMAVAGYVNPALPGQRYYGVEMLIEGFDEVDDAFLLRVFERHHHIPWTIARTKRCVLREFSMADFDALTALYDVPGLAFFLDEDGTRRPGFIEPLYPREEERAYQENYIRHMYRYYGYGMWLVLDRKSGALIGRAGLENRNYPEGVQLELGYLIHPAWQRRGIATEVCTAIIDYARSALMCGQLNLLTDADNLASIALAEKLGFRYVEDTDVSGSRTRRYRMYL